MRKLATVIGTSYRTGDPGTLNPIMATKCMTQTPVPPIAQAASTSSQARRRGSVVARARSVLTRPSSEPSTDIA